YRDNWYERRDGPPDPYNHAKVAADGKLVRLHDGIDIYAPEDEPVLSPFDGVAIDPASKWTPWEPDRYGFTVVVYSAEPPNPGHQRDAVGARPVRLHGRCRQRRADEPRLYGRARASRQGLGRHRPARDARAGHRRARSNRECRGRRAAAPLRAARAVRDRLVV